MTVCLGDLLPRGLFLIKGLMSPGLPLPADEHGSKMPTALQSVLILRGYLRCFHQTLLLPSPLHSGPEGPPSLSFLTSTFPLMKPSRFQFHPLL